MKGRRPVSAVAKLASPKSHRSAAAFKQSENGDENSKAPLVNDFNKGEGDRFDHDLDIQDRVLQSPPSISNTGVSNARSKLIEELDDIMDQRTPSNREKACRVGSTPESKVFSDSEHSTSGDEFTRSKSDSEGSHKMWRKRRSSILVVGFVGVMKR
eukprot:3935113-Rhodomonas_salina.3